MYYNQNTGNVVGFAHKGWQCPVCEQVNAPSVLNCPCSPRRQLRNARCGCPDGVCWGWCGQSNWWRVTTGGNAGSGSGFGGTWTYSGMNETTLADPWGNLPPYEGPDGRTAEPGEYSYDGDSGDEQS